MNKWIFLVLLSILLVVFQVSFLNSFNFFRNYLNIIIVVIVFLTFSTGYQKGFIFAAVSGIILDIYSPYGFIILTLALVIPVFIILNLSKKLLANKSIYSLNIVMLVSTIIFHVIIWLLTNLFFWLGWTDITLFLTKGYINIIIGQIFVHSLIVSLLYIIIKFINKKIRANILITDRV